VFGSVKGAVEELLNIFARYIVLSQGIMEHKQVRQKGALESIYKGGG
jgi:hypothetical protein